MNKAGLISLLAFIFIIVNVSELSDYKSASLIDQELAGNFLKVANQTVLEGNQRAIVFSGESTYIEQNSYHHDHIHNVSTSDWAMTGAVRAVARNKDIKALIMHGWAGGSIYIKDDYWASAQLLGIKSDRTLIDLRAVVIDELNTALYDTQAQIFGIVEYIPEMDRYYFHIK